MDGYLVSSMRACYSGSDACVDDTKHAFNGTQKAEIVRKLISKTELKSIL